MVNEVINIYNTEDICPISISVYVGKVLMIVSIMNKVRSPSTNDSK